MKLSIVATLYQSTPYIQEFYQRCTATARGLVGDDYEIVFVNDGSPDESLELAVQLTEHDAHVVVVDLSRNFGHHKAMMTGLAHAKGERVFLIDSDLEEEPEWLVEFAAAMEVESADVIYGVQEARRGNWFERWSGELYYTAFNYLANIDIPRNIVTARLMSRRYVEALLKFRESEIVIACLWVITGFQQSARPVKKHMSSPTTYTFAKKMAHVTNSITSFSEVPLRLIFYIGLVIFVVALLYSSYLILLKLVHGSSVDGWTSVMASIWLLGGMAILCLGLIGIYLSKVFSETKKRPVTIIRKIYGQTNTTY